MISKFLILIYGVIAYLAFFVVLNVTFLFIGNILVTPSLDTVGSVNLPQALIIDLGLLAAFALQHSIMARPAFKKWWTKIIPAAAERSTYVLAASLILAAIVYFWQPLGGVIWQIENSTAITILYTIFAIGVATVYLASFLINHFDLFGLRQVWLNFRGKPYTEITFRTPWLYRYCRHPLYVGLMMTFWAAPTMTITHLVFALACTGYIMIGARFEEHDYENALPEYGEYKKSVPMFMPKLT